jgi:hypothetical protein
LKKILEQLKVLCLFAMDQDVIHYNNIVFTFDHAFNEHCDVFHPTGWTYGQSHWQPQVLVVWAAKVWQDTTEFLGSF